MNGPGPCIGIWWFIRGASVCFAIAPETVPYRDGVRDSRDSHMALWPKVVRRVRHLRYVEYDEVPRGRVLLRAGVFVALLGSAELANMELQSQIIGAFGLTGFEVRFEAEEHYRTGIPGLTHALLTDDEGREQEIDDCAKQWDRNW